MKAKELIGILKQFNGDSDVFIEVEDDEIPFCINRYDVDFAEMRSTAYPGDEAITSCFIVGSKPEEEK